MGPAGPGSAPSTVPDPTFSLTTGPAARVLVAADVLAALTAARPHRPPDGLTPREVEVLRLVARGMTKRTVAHHVGHVLARTGSSTRPACALYAVQHNLLDAG